MGAGAGMGCREHGVGVAKRDLRGRQERGGETRGERAGEKRGVECGIAIDERTAAGRVQHWGSDSHLVRPAKNVQSQNASHVMEANDAP